MPAPAPDGAADGCAAAGCAIAAATAATTANTAVTAMDLLVIGDPSFLRLRLLHPAAEIQRVGVAAINVAGIVGRHAFERTELLGFRDERRHLAVLDAAGADALEETRVDLL